MPIGNPTLDLFAFDMVAQPAPRAPIDTTPNTARELELFAAVRPLADEAGLIDDSFRVTAALEAAGFERGALFAAWLAGVPNLSTVSVPGTYGHLHYQIPMD